MSGLRDTMTNLSPLQRAMDAWPLPPGEPFPGKTYIADGWVYRDLPRMTPEFFDQLVAIIGESNIRWLSLADYGSTKRGQMLVSPDGMKALTAHLKDPAP